MDHPWLKKEIYFLSEKSLLLSAIVKVGEGFSVLKRQFLSRFNVSRVYAFACTCECTFPIYKKGLGIKLEDIFWAWCLKYYHSNMSWLIY